MTSILFVKILIGLAVAVAASVVDWQKDKSSFRLAWTQNFLKYIAIFLAVVFFSVFPWWLIAVGAGATVYLLWTLIVNAVKRW